MYIIKVLQSQLYVVFLQFSFSTYGIKNAHIPRILYTFFEKCNDFATIAYFLTTFTNILIFQFV